MRWWLLVFCLICSAEWVLATQHFSHFTKKDGLTDDNVQCILRDKQGFLWVGTRKGLNRYDGHTFKHYLPDTRQAERTVSNENILDLRQDSFGFIWIATANGLNRYDPRTERFKVWKNTGRADGSLPNSLIWNIFIDPQQQLWLACDNRDLCRFDPKTGVFTTYPWKSFLDAVHPKSTTTDYKTIYFYRPNGDAGIWFMTNFGLFSFDYGSKTFDYHPYPDDEFPVAKPGGELSALFLGSWDNDLIRYEPGKRAWSRIKLPISAQLTGGRRQVTHAFRVEGQYWVTGREGLFFMNPQSMRFSTPMEEIEGTHHTPTGMLSCYYLEKNGVVWLGGANGLWLYDPSAQHFNYTQLKPAADKNFYNTFSRFLDSRVDGRRYCLDFYKKELLVIEGGMNPIHISLPGVGAMLYEDTEGVIWIGAGSGLYQLDRKNYRLKSFPVPEALAPPNSSIFYCMAKDASGNYWFGNNKAGVLVWRPEQKNWWKPDEKVEFISSSVSDLLADMERKTVWIATQDYGLFRYDEPSGKFTLYRHEESDPEHSLGAYMVNSLCKDGLGHIWAATDPGGISRFDYQSFATLNSENGLPSNQVISLVTDKSGNIWAGTLKGLAWVDTKQLQVRSFGLEDGMTSDYLDLPISVASNGNILLGAVYGYQSFNPDSLLKERPPPTIMLTSFKVFDENYTDSLNINYLKAINLSWRENFFSFEFSSSDFFQAQKNEYAYRLTGFDPDWIRLKDRHSGSYTNVPPGDYVLEIKTGREGRWYPTVVALKIHIAAPFWATTWFRLLVITLIGGAVWAVYKRRIGQIRREASLEAEFNQRLARTEMTALRAQMNPHFVFNCLSSINRFILVNQPDIASDYLTKFSRLIRLILDNSRSETVPLNKELEALQLYVEMEQMRFSNRFEFRLRVSEDVQTEHVEVPPLLIQPYVENAIWHGLMHKKEPGMLKVDLFYEQKRLCIVIEDNGVGRARALELKSRSATVQKSHGMQVTAERLEVINQLYGAKAEVFTEDMKNTSGEAAGTRVTLKISI